MGGGGFGGYGGTGSTGGTPTDIDRLEDIAREELGREEPKPRRRIFISFRHTDKTEIELFRGRAKNERTDLDFIDMSLRVAFNSENAEYIKSGIKKRIEKVSVTVVYVSDNTHESEWVNWEIEESIRQNKGVVVIDGRSDGTKKMPDAVTENRDGVIIVPKNDKEIMRAIDEAAKDR
jgi:hypothetical protein